LVSTKSSINALEMFSEIVNIIEIKT